jgi:hypothetical protein
MAWLMHACRGREAMSRISHSSPRIPHSRPFRWGHRTERLSTLRVATSPGAERRSADAFLTFSRWHREISQKSQLSTPEGHVIVPKAAERVTCTRRLQPHSAVSRGERTKSKECPGRSMRRRVSVPPPALGASSSIGVFNSPHRTSDKVSTSATSAVSYFEGDGVPDQSSWPTRPRSAPLPLDTLAPPRRPLRLCGGGRCTVGKAHYHGVI